MAASGVSFPATSNRRLARFRAATPWSAAVEERRLKVIQRSLQLGALVLCPLLGVYWMMQLGFDQYHSPVPLAVNVGIVIVVLLIAIALYFRDLLTNDHMDRAVVSGLRRIAIESGVVVVGGALSL
ncbi:MAG: hypothetical protein KDA28_08545, partial [Phycisphaerales bacterium]|nr:hypothetical protein [Phycisphaerales bacterium]